MTWTGPAARTLAVLAAINLLNYLDRYVLAGVVPDLKADLHLSDARIGALATAFMLVYSLAAPTFGWYGDRVRRSRPISLGVGLWSLATFASAFAAGYGSLLGARALVGVGEAAYVAIAPALLADLFPPAQRARALAALNLAMPVGTALGYQVGGLVSTHFGWRAAFMVAGAPGLLLALAALWLPEPRRGALDEPGVPSARRPDAAPPAGGWAAVQLGLLRRPVYRLIVLGYAAYTFGVGGLAVWMPTFLNRERGVSLPAATTGFGVIVIVCGFFGTFVGGWLGDRWRRRTPQAWMWLSAGATLLAVPCVVVALRAPAPAIFYPAIIVAQLLVFASTGPVNAALVDAVGARERATAMALCMLLIHMLGDVPSPVLIGRVSDQSTLALGVLLVPAAIAVAGLLWVLAARAQASETSGAA